MRTVKQEYIEEYYDNGNKKCEKYKLNGKLHRENGIAYKSWYENGNIWIEQYWLNGKYLTKEKFDNRNNSSCSVSVSGKIVEIDGKKYKLNEV